jgi:hypothetical protein
LYLWEGTVVPQVALVWEAVADESKLALFDVLLNRVERLFFRDLEKSYMINIVLNKMYGYEAGDIVAPTVMPT